MATGGPTIELPTKQKCPIIGLGTWQSQSNQPAGQMRDAVATAIDCGYRHIDNAFAYHNQNEVGEAIQAKIAEGKIKREDIFLTSKLWCTFHHPDDVEKACTDALKLMKLDYFDLYLMHYPFAFKRGDNWWPVGDDGKLICDDTDYVETWKAMENLVERGLCKAIGVSNFTVEFLKRILKINKVPVSNLQVEAHPYLAQQELFDFCKSKGIPMTAYSPLGSPDRPSFSVGENDPVLLEDPVVNEIAKSKGKSPAQILIRYNLQRGLACTPKSVTPSRIQENFEAIDFELIDEEVTKLRNLNKDFRYLPFPQAQIHPLYPFSECLKS